VWALVVITVLLGVVTVALSVRRWRTLLELGAGVALAMALAVGAVAAVKNQILELITDPVNRAAAQSTLLTLVDSFQSIAKLLIVLGLALAVGAFVSGDHPRAKAVRGLVGRGSKAAAAGVSPVRAP
jgi:heme A synthase